MKKKSIFVVALAATMLVAFTACEQQVPNVLPDDVNYITIVQTEDAVEGKAPNLAELMKYPDKTHTDTTLTEF